MVRRRSWQAITFRGRHLLVLDAAVTLTSIVLAFGLRFDAPSAQFAEFLVRYLWIFPLLVLARTISFVVFGLYQRVWRYASVAELQAIAIAVLASSTVAYGAVFGAGAIDPDLAGFPRSIPIIDTLVVLALIGGMRFGFLVTRLGRRDAGATTPTRAIIVGAGASGVAVARQLLSETHGLQVVGYVDDEEAQGRRLLGLPVLGSTSQLGSLIKRHGVGTILFALPATPGRTLRALVRAAESEGARCLTVPSMTEVLAGHVTAAVRSVDVEDLLRRAPAKIDIDSVREAIGGRTVLITGAGGSVGTELSRQVLRLGPSDLLLVGRGENSIYDLLETIRPIAEQTRLHPIILDVRDRAGVDQLIGATHPDVVFHAAAHKHVYFMERHPEEAVATNVFGTANVLAACEANGVPSFVLVSTDKAVRPSNAMGATKRLAELLVRDAALRSGHSYVTVRFGNVLSSRGSVLPLFRRQLAAGGPLTVTHPDVRRYFMTIAEAVQLILQATAIGRPGETVVLDMGEPVRIQDLARDLIELHGYEAGVDIEIVYTGLTPGEKLDEDLFFPDEKREATTHESLWLAVDEVGRSIGRAELETLRRAAERHDQSAVLEELHRLVPDYQPPIDRVRADAGSPVASALRGST